MPREAVDLTRGDHTPETPTCRKGRRRHASSRYRCGRARYSPKSSTWLQSPNPSLHGRTPLQAAHTQEGCAQADDILTGMEAGVLGACGPSDCATLPIHPTVVKAHGAPEAAGTPRAWRFATCARTGRSPCWKCWCTGWAAVAPHKQTATRDLCKPSSLPCPLDASLLHSSEPFVTGLRKCPRRAERFGLATDPPRSSRASVLSCGRPECDRSGTLHFI